MVGYSRKIAGVLIALVFVSAGSFAQNNEQRAQAFQVKGSDAGTVKVIAQPSPDAVITLDVSQGTATPDGLDCRSDRRPPMGVSAWFSTRPLASRKLPPSATPSGP